MMTISLNPPPHKFFLCEYSKGARCSLHGLIRVQRWSRSKFFFMIKLYIANYPFKFVKMEVVSGITHQLTWTEIGWNREKQNNMYEIRL